MNPQDGAHHDLSPAKRISQATAKEPLVLLMETAMDHCDECCNETHAEICQRVDKVFVRAKEELGE